MSLAQHISQQIERIEALQQLLEQEQQILGQGQIDGEQLQAIATQKQELQQQLDRQEAIRRAAQLKLGYEATSQGARQAAAQAGCADLWATLLERTQRVAHLNHLNGELIQHRLHHNQHMLNILRDAAGSAPIYDAAGQSKTTPQRINSKA
ncbi:flagella synthesis protein FlgN [Pseudidiomarina indica]|uniref:Flagella synthesis protein FlgN n=1 Tax=Pseudidiomarina indica TaxID=1159017 RepID=A0A1G6BYR1_9GAMM|nr:flagellar protein FlgN [Pseudidiomarina indica]SDB25755.1 flagella synthesis protein FlgN [Pseudidiomarina indica]